MAGVNCFKCKVFTLIIITIVSLVLFFASLGINYQIELAKEHIRFRKNFPSQANWLYSPDGRLKIYLFNVTNAEEFLNGNDTRMRVEQVGPIVYRLKGRNVALNQTENSYTFRRIRYDNPEFDAEASCSPDIFNKTVTIPNLMLLGAAAKFNEWKFLVRYVFNAITINEPVFLTQSVHYFLWEFKRPGLNLLSNYMPNIVSNCGMLYNALRPNEEVYNVNIGIENGFENFFTVNSLNNETYFPQRKNVLKNAQNPDEYCPIDVENAFDNSLFPPFLSPQKKFQIVATESCRVLPMNYQSTVQHLGFQGYRYSLEDQNDKPSCLDYSSGIKLPKGMFDVAKCLFNDVPSAFSFPHFYGSDYNYSQHFEGIQPQRDEHEAHIIIEPITGIPIEERYRFQSNIPMPSMEGYTRDLQKFSNVMVPSFWYEYDLDDLPGMILLLIRFNTHIVPVLQPVLMSIFVVSAILSLLKLYLLLSKRTLSDILCKREKISKI